MSADLDAISLPLDASIALFQSHFVGMEFAQMAISFCFIFHFVRWRQTNQMRKSVTFLATYVCGRELYLLSFCFRCPLFAILRFVFASQPQILLSHWECVCVSLFSFSFIFFLLLHSHHLSHPVSPAPTPSFLSLAQL